MIIDDAIVVATAMLISLAVVVAVMLLAARPPAGHAAVIRRERSRAAVDPREVRLPDVVERLRREGLPEADVALVLEAAERRLVAPAFLWSWVERFGARALAVAVVGGLTTAELAGALMRGRCPDLDSLAVLAGVRGLSPQLCGGAAELRHG
ncbi:hypothetical protein K8Z61_17160 [Nocardioides sp. TRM66260-LWL]|uniref:hypothetical protein n=1 Tax=Nocardioides sp. TRM66260-LWL TaxID=2874478 RepID=UPI001CC5A018|nr:hypothetical protein [Nocardioides sp. TRM66260-LWL]MBZ5736225.1 hypothetical protein [Nocardioides sp. TRM66260-LWL]